MAALERTDAGQRFAEVGDLLAEGTVVLGREVADDGYQHLVVPWNDVQGQRPEPRRQGQFQQFEGDLEVEEEGVAGHGDQFEGGLQVVHPELVGERGVDGHVERALLAHDDLLQHFVDAAFQLFGQVAGEYSEEFVDAFF